MGTILPVRSLEPCGPEIATSEGKRRTSEPVTVGSRPLRRSARVGPVEIPVSAHRADPPAGVVRDQTETADHALSAFMVPVEKVDHHGRGSVMASVAAAKSGSSLSRKVPCRSRNLRPDIEVAGEASKILGLTMITKGLTAQTLG